MMRPIHLLLSPAVLDIDPATHHLCPGLHNSAGLGPRLDSHGHRLTPFGGLHLQYGRCDQHFRPHIHPNGLVMEPAPRELGDEVQ